MFAGPLDPFDVILRRRNPSISDMENGIVVTIFHGEGFGGWTEGDESIDVTPFAEWDDSEGALVADLDGMKRHVAGAIGEWVKAGEAPQGSMIREGLEMEDNVKLDRSGNPVEIEELRDIIRHVWPAVAQAVRGSGVSVHPGNTKNNNSAKYKHLDCFEMRAKSTEDSGHEPPINFRFVVCHGNVFAGHAIEVADLLAFNRDRMVYRVDFKALVQRIAEGIDRIIADGKNISDSTGGRPRRRSMNESAGGSYYGVRDMADELIPMANGAISFNGLGIMYDEENKLEDAKEGDYTLVNIVSTERSGHDPKVFVDAVICDRAGEVRGACDRPLALHEA